MELLVSYATKQTDEVMPRYAPERATDTAVLARVDVEAGQVVPLLEYQSPVENRHPDLRVAFKAGHFHGEHLYLPTSTEILVLKRGDWTIERVISLPCFNDLHHVFVDENGMIVCNTGLDNVVWLTPDGELVRQRVLLDSDLPARYPRETDFRKVFSTKPHNVHPNYLFRGPGGELFVTCFFQQRAINIDDPEDAYAIDVGNPHDGLLYNGKVFFTTTNGHVVAFDALSRARLWDWDLKKLWRERHVLGWCRGICIADGRLFVGFSKIRRTKSQEFIQWLKWGMASSLLSRIVEVDLQTGQPVRQVTLPDDSAPIFHVMPAG